MADFDQATYWQYEQLQEDGTIKIVGTNRNDFDAKITGKYVFGVKAYFDENPEEAHRLGWVKHIMHDTSKWIAYNKQTQYLVRTTKTIDKYTYEDVYLIMDKTEDMMRAAEEAVDGWTTYDSEGIRWVVN